MAEFMFILFYQFRNLVCDFFSETTTEPQKKIMSSYQSMYSNGSPLALRECLADPMRSHQFRNKVDVITYQGQIGNDALASSLIQSTQLTREDAKRKIIINTCTTSDDSTSTQIVTLPPAASCPGSVFTIHFYGYTNNQFELLTADPNGNSTFEEVMPLVFTLGGVLNGNDNEMRTHRIVGVRTGRSASSTTSVPIQVSRMEALSVGTYWIIRVNNANNPSSIVSLFKSFDLTPPS
jgi:hypothetical protein